MDINLYNNSYSIEKAFQILSLSNNFNALNVDISNNIIETKRNKPYGELLVYNFSEKVYYDYVVNDNTFSISDFNNLDIETSPTIIINDKRFFLMDISIVVKNPELNENEINIPFKSNPNLFANLKAVATLNNVEKTNPYIETYVSRSSIWVYYPNTTVYLLVNYNNKTINEFGFAIYAMQTYCNLVDKNLRYDDLIYLTDKLNNKDLVGENVLPPLWTYCIVNLDNTTYMNVVSIDTAVVIQDSLSNTYNYVSPIFCKFLYNMYIK